MASAKQSHWVQSTSSKIPSSASYWGSRRPLVCLVSPYLVPVVSLTTPLPPPRENTDPQPNSSIDACPRSPFTPRWAFALAITIIEETSPRFRKAKVSLQPHHAKWRRVKQNYRQSNYLLVEPAATELRFSRPTTLFYHILQHMQRTFRFLG